MNEISAENRGELEKRYKVTVFIVSAQIFSAFVLVGAAWLVTREQIAEDELFLTLWLVILFISAGTFVLRRRFFSWEKLKNTALLRGIPGLIALLQTNTILLTLIAEMVLIIGFLIAVLNANVFDMLRASGIALILFVINFPRRSVWEKIVSTFDQPT